MIHRGAQSLLRIYVDPAAAVAVPAGEWVRIIAAARRSRTMGLLGHRLEQAGALSCLDARIRGHFESTSNAIAGRRQQLRRELYEVGQAFREAPYALGLLKESAYEVLGLPLAGTRIVSDVDILVRRGCLEDAERRLRGGGWAAKELVDYDERYYREWSHELPPFIHPQRGIEVDVHHTISPERRRVRIPIESVFARCVALPWIGGLRFEVPEPTDLLVHAALHTFCDSDLDLRVREVMVFDLLYRHFTERIPDLDRRLTLRAIEFGRGGALWWAFHFSRRWLGTPVSGAALDALPGPCAVAREAMDWLADRAMLPPEAGKDAVLDKLSSAALLARYQWHRLPLHRLVPHVVEKARRRLVDRRRRLGHDPR